MMEDNKLLNIALYCTFIGITALLLLSYFDKIPATDISEIGCNDVGKYVKIEGKIRSVSYKNQSTLISIGQECSLNVFTFENLKLDKNDTVIVEGTVDEYNGRLSINAEKISRVSK